MISRPRSPFRPLPSRIFALALPLTLLLAAHGLADEPTPAPVDRLRALQVLNIATAKQSIDRVYHFGSQGGRGLFSNHTNHTNRLIPFYTFGRKVDLGAVLGGNSVYRSRQRLKDLFGFEPVNTVNPEAEYADQSDFYKVQSGAVAKGAKYLFIVWFDGLDWPTTRAAAVARTGKVYREGKGSGLIFQDYTAEGSAQFGYYATCPTYDKNLPDQEVQTIKIPADSLRGGYDAAIAGPNPWTLGPLGDRAPGYLKGQLADDQEKAGVAALGRVLHAYTDSSTSAGEFVTGRKAYNSGVNVLDDGSLPTTLFRQLQGKGWKVGTVTSVPFDHASPAAMYAHNVERDDYQDIARDMLGLPSILQAARHEPVNPGLDVVIGTGFGQEASEKGLIAQGKNAVKGNLYLAASDQATIDATKGGRYFVAQTEPGALGAKALDDAAAKAAAEGKRLFGFFGTKEFNHLPFQTADGGYNPAPNLTTKAEVYTAADLVEQPTLADMTHAAIRVVSARPGEPFALFIEAGDVDFALHANNLDNAIGAVYSGEAAIRVVIDWVEKNSNWDESVMIVAADHGHYLVVDDIEAIAATARPR